MHTQFIEPHCVPPHLRYELQRCSKASGRQLEKLYALRCFEVHGGREIRREDKGYEKFSKDCCRAFANGDLIVTTTTQKIPTHEQ